MSYQGHPDRHRRPRRKRPASKSCPACHRGLFDGACRERCFTGRTHDFHALTCGCDPILLEAPGRPEPCARCGAPPVAIRARSIFEALALRDAPMAVAA